MHFISLSGSCFFIAATSIANPPPDYDAAFTDYFWRPCFDLRSLTGRAILLIVIGYKVFDKLTPQLDFNDLIKKGNLAMAIVVGSFILGLCFVVAHVVSAILGG